MVLQYSIEFSIIKEEKYDRNKRIADRGYENCIKK
jgi:hypothetical protein